MMKNVDVKVRCPAYSRNMPIRRHCKCQERCRCKKRCRCGTCKCRKKTSVFGHPQDVNADLESMKENYKRAKRAAKLAIFNAKNAERLKFRLVRLRLRLKLMQVQPGLRKVRLRLRLKLMQVLPGPRLVRSRTKISLKFPSLSQVPCNRIE